MRHNLTCPGCHRRTLRAWEESQEHLPIVEGGRSYTQTWSHEKCDHCDYYRREQTG